MRQWIFPMVALVAAVSPVVSRADGPSDRPEDRKAIEALTVEFVHAFNKGDAAAVGKLFTPEARVVDEEGQAIEGRDAVVQHFTGAFTANPGSKIVIKPEALYFLGPDAAVENGSAVVTRADGSPDKTDYSVVYIRSDGRWLHASVEDHPPRDESPIEKMKELEPLMGEWVSESTAAVVRFHYQWNETHSFLIATFEAQVAGKPSSSGTERIGWDPLTKRFRSWVFDSKGGWSEGLWTRASGTEWIIKTTGVRSDGELASSTRHMTWETKNRIAVQVRDRTLGGRTVAEDVTFTMVRKPPKPQ